MIELRNQSPAGRERSAPDTASAASRCPQDPIDKAHFAMFVVFPARPAYLRILAVARCSIAVGSRADRLTLSKRVLASRYERGLIFLADGDEDGAALQRSRNIAEAEKNTVFAPRKLCTLRCQYATVSFLAKIYDLIFVQKVAAMVDLRPCRTITPEACLLLTAELERCVRQRPQTQVWVRYPNLSAMSDDLDDFGFFSHLKMDQPVRFRPRRTDRQQKGAILVRSGVKEEITLKLRDIASVTNALYADSAYAEAVEIALQEAMTNVMSHAFPGGDAQQPARWWFAGRTDEKRNEAVFYALDLGVGIPARAPTTMGNEITEFWLRQSEQPPVMRDKHILEAAVKARRIEGIEARNNNGLPAMIGLVETDSWSGSVQIDSGRAGYEFSKKVGQNGHPVCTERCYGFRRPFPGTLVVWRVAGPARAQLRA
jgi:hypothetical protein